MREWWFWYKNVQRISPWTYATFGEFIIFLGIHLQQPDLNSIRKFTKMVRFIRWHYIEPLHSFLSHFEWLQMVYSYIFHSNIFLTLFLICILVDGYITSVIDTTYWFVAELYIMCSANILLHSSIAWFRPESIIIVYVFTCYVFK
jgi:hypothetical protein